MLSSQQTGRFDRHRKTEEKLFPLRFIAKERIKIKFHSHAKPTSVRKRRNRGDYFEFSKWFAGTHTETYFLVTQLKSSKDGRARYFLAYESFSAGNNLVYLTRHKAAFSKKVKRRAPRGESKQWGHEKRNFSSDKKKRNEKHFFIASKRPAKMLQRFRHTHSRKKEAFIFILSVPLPILNDFLFHQLFFHSVLCYFLLRLSFVLLLFLPRNSLPFRNDQVLCVDVLCFCESFKIGYAVVLRCLLSQ